MEAFIGKIQNDDDGDDFVEKWRKEVDKNLNKKRKVGKELITFKTENNGDDARMDKAA